MFERLDYIKVEPRVILDLHCALGASSWQLAKRFPGALVIPCDPAIELLKRHVVAKKRFLRFGKNSTRICGEALALPIAAKSVDLIWSNLFPLSFDAPAIIREIKRVLKPGGVLLFAESTKRYIHSWMIRWLFRHPMEAQKTADEYIALIRACGFELPPERLSFPYLWWSREDLGLMERLGVAPPTEREETLVNAVAVKPTN